MNMPTENFIQSLQASITPCIFISGLGLVLLSMTNRLGRSVDRIRLFTAELKTAADEGAPGLRAQINIIYRRCHILQTAIGLVAVSMFFVSSIMLMLFSTLAFNIQLIAFIKIFFTASLGCFILALVFFFRDVCLSLDSLKIEMEQLNKIPITKEQ